MADMSKERFVSLPELARALGWHRTTTRYWCERAQVELVRLGVEPWLYVRAGQMQEAIHRLREARGRRRHDGHGQHGRPYGHPRPRPAPEAPAGHSGPPGPPQSPTGPSRGGVY